MRDPATVQVFEIMLFVKDKARLSSKIRITDVAIMKEAMISSHGIYLTLPSYADLTDLPLDKMAAISQTIFPDAFP